MPLETPASSVAPPERRGRPHDVRLDEPTAADRRRNRRWLVLLLLTPVCLGVVVYAALGTKAAPYPEVKPLQPAGWQVETNPYVGLSIPPRWQLNTAFSDQNGDSYWAGTGGVVAESVSVTNVAPTATRKLPEIIGVFLRTGYQVTGVTPITLTNATVAWRYQFALANGQRAVGVHAWVKDNQTEVWFVVTPPNATTDHVLSTLTLGP